MTVPSRYAFRAGRPANQRGSGLVTLIRDELVFQQIWETFIPPLECLTVRVQLSHQQMDHTPQYLRGNLTDRLVTWTPPTFREYKLASFKGIGLNAHTPRWVTYVVKN